MRVLMTADNVGGVWRYALELVDALAAEGVEVTLATTGAPLDRDQQAELSACRAAMTEHRPFKLEWMDDPWDDVARAGQWLLDLRDRSLPDVVHLNGYAAAALPWDVPRLVVGHSCVLSWFEAVRGKPAPAEWEPYRRAVAGGLAAADCLVAPTRAMLAELRRLYEPRCERLVIPNGCRPRTLPAPKQPFVLGAGRLWDDAKNAAALDRAAARLPWPVLLGGAEGPPAAHAHVLGRLSSSELADLLAAAAIFAAPARYEPFGLAALEAARAGCALVLGDIPSLREVWGDAALYVAPSRPDELRDALDRLIEDEALRAEAATAARVRSRRYTVERMARRYAGLYTRLARVGPVAA